MATSKGFKFVFKATAFTYTRQTSLTFSQSVVVDVRVTRYFLWLVIISRSRNNSLRSLRSERARAYLTTNNINRTFAPGATTYCTFRRRTRFGDRRIFRSSDQPERNWLGERRAAAKYRTENRRYRNRRQSRIIMSRRTREGVGGQFSGWRTRSSCSHCHRYIVACENVRIYI